MPWHHVRVPTSLSFDQHLDVIRTAGDRLADLGSSVDEATRVPTCPAWTVRELLAHQTMVHRWATANVTGDDPEGLPSQTDIAATVDDIVRYYRKGLDLLVSALASAPPDLEAATFLNDAPAPRRFWARRQAHETTMHMVDALAATLGRTPTAAEAAVTPAVAADGIDELLCGFFTRGRSKLFDGEDYTMLVQPSDDDRRWLVRVAERLTTEAFDGVDGVSDIQPEVTITGRADELYLGLWNRGDRIAVEGRPDLLDRWRDVQRVTWG